MGLAMFNRELKREIRELKYDLKEMAKHVCCLRGLHEWIVVQGMIIRCKHCHKQADKMPDATNTDSKDAAP